MRAGELAQAMGMELLTPGLADQELALSGCYLGDLLSNVMASGAPGRQPAGDGGFGAGVWPGDPCVHPGKKRL